MPKEKLRKIRGSAMTMIFQEPMTSLNPVLTVGSQIAEAVYYHRGGGKAAAKKRALATHGYGENTCPGKQI
jgi:ABC-type microcin C transport system duplicated ATPase subunit YejF